MILEENIQKIREEVSKYPREITLVAASKTQDKATLDEFMHVAPDFILGENRVQELVAKYDPSYHWHLIGQLQTNKVKYIIDKVEMIHSLDRLDLADEIQKQATKHNLVMDALIEINMGAEITKGGVEPDKAIDFIKSLSGYDRIRIKGLMAVMPAWGDTPQLRALYAKLQSLFESAKKEINQPNADVKILSAGMTSDWQIALEYGSNMLRLGRVLFGERYYPPKAE